MKTGKEIEKDFGIPIVNKRISVTPIALIGGAACKKPEDFARIAKFLYDSAPEQNKRTREDIAKCGQMVPGAGVK